MYPICYVIINILKVEKNAEIFLWIQILLSIYLSWFAYRKTVPIRMQMNLFKLISYSDIHYMRMLFQCKYSNSFQDSNIHILLASLYNICITLSIYYCVYVIPKTYNNSRKFCIFGHWLSIYICCTESIDISLKNLSCNICSERYTFCGLLDCSKNRFPLLLWKFIPEASGLRAEIAFHEQDQWRTHFKPRGISEF